MVREEKLKQREKRERERNKGCVEEIKEESGLWREGEDGIIKGERARVYHAAHAEQS